MNGIIPMLRVFFQDGLAVGLLGVLLAIFALLMFQMHLLKRTWRRALSGALAPVLEGKDRFSENHIGRALNRGILGVKHDGPRRQLITAQDIQSQLEGSLDGAIASSRSFALGGSLTGVALIFTFFLIALVLSNDISSAIQTSATTSTAPPTGAVPLAVGTGLAAATRSLDGAVRLLGAKFLLSAVGILLTILHLLYARSIRGGLLAEVSSSISKLEPHVVPSATTETEHRKEVAALLRAQLSVAENASLFQQAHAGRMEDGLSRLQSIEVSVKDLGSDVATNLNQIMRASVGEELSKVMALMNDAIERIAGAVTDSMTKELEQVRGLLERLRASVENQSAPHLENIVTQMRDMMSGGFQSESANLSQVLQRFAEVVPALSEQLQTLVVRVSADMRAGTDRTQAMADALLDRLSNTLAALEEQQRNGLALVDSIGRASTAGAEELTRNIARAGQTAVQGLIEGTSGELSRLLGNLEAASEAGLSRYVNVEKSLESIGALLEEVQARLGMSANSIGELTVQMNPLLTEGRRQAEASQAALAAFQRATTEMAKAMGGIQATAQTTTGHISSQQNLLEQQREYAAMIQKTWPQLFDTYLGAFRRHSEELDRSWQTIYEKLGQAISRAGGGFTESVDALAESVDKLEKALPNGRRAA